MMENIDKHQAKKIEAGVYDYRGFRIVFYEMPDSSKHYWQLYKVSDGAGSSSFDGYDSTDFTTHSLANAKELIDRLT